MIATRWLLVAASGTPCRTIQRPERVSTRATATSAGSLVLLAERAARPATASTAVGNREAAQFPSGTSRSHSSTPGDIDSGRQPGPSTIIPGASGPSGSADSPISRALRTALAMSGLIAAKKGLLV